MRAACDQLLSISSRRPTTEATAIDFFWNVEVAHIQLQLFQSKNPSQEKGKLKHTPLMLHSVSWECVLLSFCPSWLPSENSMWIFCVQNLNDGSRDWQDFSSSCTFSEVLFLGSFLFQHRKGSSWDRQCLCYHSETCQGSSRGYSERVSVDFEAQKGRAEKSQPVS